MCTPHDNPAFVYSHLRPLSRAIIPDRRNPAKCLTIDGNAANRREGQVCGDKQFATGRRFLQQAYAYAHRFIGGACSKPLCQSGWSKAAGNGASPAKVRRSSPEELQRA